MPRRHTPLGDAPFGEFLGDAPSATPLGDRHLSDLNKRSLDPSALVLRPDKIQTEIPKMYAPLRKTTPGYCKTDRFECFSADPWHEVSQGGRKNSLRCRGWRGGPRASPLALPPPTAVRGAAPSSSSFEALRPRAPASRGLPPRAPRFFSCAVAPPPRAEIRSAHDDQSGIIL